MVIDAPFFHCFCCSRRFSPDPDQRQGGFINAWKVTVCRRCLADNRDGLPPKHPGLKQLARRGTVLKPDADGLVRWPEELSVQIYRPDADLFLME